MTGPTRPAVTAGLWARPAGRTLGPQRTWVRLPLALVVTLACILGGTRPGLAQSTEATPPVPTITVSGYWDGGLPASWSAYTAVVKNMGKEGFGGELFIGPADAATTGPARPPAAPLVGAARHRTPLALGPGEERRISAVLVVSPVSYAAQVRDHGGRLVSATEPRPLAATPGEAIGLLSDSVSGRGLFLSGAGSSVALSERFRSARDFPSATALLRGLAAVVIADFDSATLSPGQHDALRGFLNLGGSLVVAGGAAWERTVRPLPEDLAPLRPTATAPASLAPMADLAAVPGDATVTAATGALVGGRTVLQGAEQIPLLVEKDYGAGRVVQLAFDPLVDLATPASRTLAGLARDHALTRAGVGGTAPGPTGPVAVGADDFQAVVDPPVREPAGLVPLALVLGLYAVVLGPAAYLVVRRRRAGALWAVTPVLAVGVAVTAWAAALPLGPAAVDHQVQVQRQAVGGTLLVDSWHRLLPAGSGDTEVGLGPDTLAWVEPRPTGRPLGLPPLVAPLVAGEPVGGDDGPSTVRREDRARIGFGRWPVWAGRTVRTSTVTRQPPVLEADLRVEGGMVVGRVSNRGNAPVRELRLQAPDGTGAAVASALGPGQEQQVRVALAPPGRPAAAPSAAPGSAEALRDLVRSRLVARPGEVDLVGLVPARPVLQVGGSTPTTRSQAVLVATARLQADAAELGAAGLGAPRLVCACGVAGPLVSEVQLPPGAPGPLVVSAPPAGENPPADAVEVFHWPSRAWRSLPGAVGLPGPAALESGDLEGGIVRLRVRSPTLVSAVRVVPAGT